MVKNKQETIFVIAAHSDDQVLGAGGSIAKWILEGKKVIVIIMSYGESTHPWLKKKVAARMRVSESIEAGKILGIEKTIFLGLDEGKFKEQFPKKQKELIEIIKKEKPIKIITHATDDPHPDHRAISKLVVEMCEKIKYKGDIYAFNIWTFVNVAKSELPKLFIDISDTFKLKNKALKCFKSQWMAMVSLLWSVYFRAIKNGRHINVKYAEVFFKIK